MLKPKFKLEEQPVDAILSVHIRNLFATYGEKKVRQTMKTLFGMKSKDSKKKVA